jgi:hypothetical protein
MAAPQATQSPPDLVRLYAKLYQQDRAANEFDRGLAGVFAGMKGPPGGAQQIMNSVGPAQDPGAMLQNLLQMQQMQNMIGAGPAITQALTGGGGAPGAGGAPSAGGAAPGAGAIGAGGVTSGLPADVIARLPIDTRLKMLDQMMQSRMQLAQKGAETKQADLLEAQQKAPDQMTQIQQMNKLADSVKGATNADGTPVMQGILGSSRKIAAANELMGASEPGWLNSAEGLLAQSQLSPQEQQTIQNLKQLSGQLYSEAFTSTGSRRTQQEVRNLQEGLSPLKNFNQPYEGYMSQFGNFQNQLNKSYVNNLGAAGRLDEIPDNMKWDFSDPKNPKPLVNSAYLPGGDMYAGGGGQWASNPPKAGKEGEGFNYAAIPSGTVYTAPDGTQRRKP